MTIGRAIFLIAQTIASLCLLFPWLVGLVIAQGFWSTAFALFPPYAWYLVVELWLKYMGII